MSSIKHFNRSSLKNIDDNTLEVQLVEFCEDDIVDFENKQFHEYRVRMFGITEKGVSVCIRVKNFKPFFFLELPDDFTENHKEDFIDELREEGYENRRGDAKTLRYSLNDSEHEIVEKYKCDGFQRKTTKFLKMSFKSLFGYNTVKKHFLRLFKGKKKITFNRMAWKCRLFESDIAPILRFFHDRDIPTCGWVTISNREKVQKKDMISNCQYECLVYYQDIDRLEKEIIGPLTICSYDIECTSGDGSFPQACREDDKIIQIGSTIENYTDKNKYYNNIITLGGCEPLQETDTEVISCNTELGVLYEWAKLMKKLCVDVITGYNINGFDFAYMYDRLMFLTDTSICSNAKKNVIDFLDEYYIHPDTGSRGSDYVEGTIQDKIEKVREMILDFSKIKYSKKKVYLRTKELISSAYGENYLKYYTLEGVINMDLLSYVRKEFKLESYKLDNVAKKFIGSQKNDVSANDIFRLQQGSDDDRRIIAEYCIQDCKLCNDLLRKLSVIENTFGMATTCYVPNNYLSFRGQGIKGHSLVVKNATEMDYLIPSTTEDRDSEYKGATVIEPQIGSHFYPVTCLDFASLYPSCMISHNLCITSIVTDEKDLNIPGRTYKSISWDDDFGNEVKYTYIQPETEDKRALLPTILKMLLQKRKDTRKKQKLEKDPFKASILNGLQLSYKITANSVYGLLGASTSAISRPEVAACITTTGRNLLDVAATRTMKHFRNSSIVYGDTDSVFVKFELRNHKESCDFHPSKIEERFKRFEFFLKKKTNELKKRIEEGEFVDIEHSLEETAMKECKFQLYKDCDCELYENMSKEALQKSIDLGLEAERIFDYLLPYPHKLEYEKTYQPYISFAKKRYIGWLYEFDVNKKKLDYKGIVLKRRDNAPIVKQLYNGCIHKILEGGFDNAIKYVDEQINDMFNDKITDLSLFTVTKTLKSLGSYKIPFMKKSYFYGDAVKLLEMRLLLEDKISVQEFEAVKKLLKYTHDKKKNSDSKIAKVIEDGMLSLWDVCNSCETIRNCIKNVNMKEFKKLRFTRDYISYTDLVKILVDDCGFELKKFKGIQKLVIKKTNMVEIKKFINLYEPRIEDLIKRKVSQSHVQLNERIRKKDPGQAYQTNERIPYCFVYKKFKKGQKVMQGDLVELPENIKKEGKKLDYLYYLEKQIENPLLQLFEMIKRDGDLKEIFDKYKTIEKNKRSGIRTLKQI